MAQQAGMVNTYSHAHMQLFSNPAQMIGNSCEGTHGGEAAEVRKHSQVQQFGVQVPQEVEKHTKERLHVAPRILRLKHVSVLVISIYLWSGEGPTDRVFVGLRQFRALRTCAGLPFLAAGDSAMILLSWSKLGG